MEYAADLVVLIHFAWVVFMVGGVLGSWMALAFPRLLRLRRLRWTHIVGLVLTASWGVLGHPCPLTTLEYRLRELSGGGVTSVPPDSFLIRLAERVIFPNLDPRLLTWLTVSCTLSVLAIMVWRPPPSRRDRCRTDRDGTK